MGLNRLTAERYITLLDLFGIIRICPSWSRNPANELKKGKKFYFFDVGVRNALLGDFSPLAGRTDARALWENFFFMECVKLHDARRDCTRMCFWQSTGSSPVGIDLVEVVNNRPSQGFVCLIDRHKPKARVTDRRQAKFMEVFPQATVTVVSPRDCLRLFCQPAQSNAPGAT